MFTLDISTLEFLSDSLTNPCHFCGFLFEEKRLGFVFLQQTIHGVGHCVGVSCAAESDFCTNPQEVCSATLKTDARHLSRSGVNIDIFLKSDVLIPLFGNKYKDWVRNVLMKSFLYFTAYGFDSYDYI